MSRRQFAYGVALLSTLAALVASPTTVWAASGGSGLTPSSDSSGGSSQPPRSGNAVVSASGDGVTIATRAAAVLNGVLRVSGNVDGGGGKSVAIQRLGHQTHWAWATTTTTTVASDGSFTATWHVNHIGQFKLRAVIGSGRTSHAAAASPTLTVTVYRPALATIFGPGFYGNQTACGETLHHTTIGVANRTLPCGTQVALLYHGRTLVVPVIDRGPYANGADWDLTEATAKRLGMTGTDTIGAVSLPKRT